MGLGFLADQALEFVTAVLHGFRRFDAANLLPMATVLLQAAGIFALLEAGASLLAIGGWSFVARGLTVAAALTFVERLQPAYRLRLGRFHWRSVAGHIPFGFTIRLTGMTSKAVWDIPPLLIGVLLGSASIVPYYIGQRFPGAVSLLS